MAFTLYQHVEIAACPIDGIVQQYKNFICIIYVLCIRSTLRYTTCPAELHRCTGSPLGRP
jgi:hypothetical protein